VVERCVASDAQDPGGEGNLALLVLADRRDQLREDVLSDVFGLVKIVEDAVDVEIGRASCRERV